MLTLWRRHRSTCSHKSDRYYRKCRCAMWCEGTVEGVYRRESLKTRSWERAKEVADEIEAGIERPSIPDNAKAPTLATATQIFLSDLVAQNRAADTVRKYRLLFSQLSDLGANRPIAELTFDALVKFRSGWKEKGAATRNKKLDRLKAFFSFCHDAGWISTNPTKAIKPAAIRTALVKPFTQAEQDFLISQPQTRQISCFVRILYYSALRISDACMLRPQDFDGNRIRRVNQKNNETVLIPIPPDLRADLDRLTLNGGYYFLQGQSEKHYTQTDAWRTILNDLYKEKMPGFHPHRFRHTAAVNWLAHGLTMEEVAGLLGNSVKVCEKHYASFCSSRQEVVERKLEARWNKLKLQRVK